MYFEREEMMEDMVNLVIGIIDDYSDDKAQMKEELSLLLDSDEEGIFLEPKTYFEIVKRVDNSDVHKFFLEHIQSNAPEIFQQILNQKPELIQLLHTEGLSEELGNNDSEKAEEEIDPQDWKTGWEW